MDIGDLDPDPIRQFTVWQADADDEGAVALATATATGAPSVRMVLLKGVDARGFTFFTNYGSHKGRDLAVNPSAALAFHWPPQRQVRVEGRVVRLESESSDRYWASRPRSSQLGAWASEQSATIADRSVLEARLSEAEQRFGDGAIPRPSFWGGFVVIPDRIEFWHHRDDRLHDRIEYVAGDEGWIRRRLSP